MQTKFQITKKEFLKNIDINSNIFKKFEIQVDHLIFKTIFKQKNKDFNISIEIYGWSSKNQTYVPIKDSVFFNELDKSKDSVFFNELDKSSDFNFKDFLLKYSIIAKKLLEHFATFKNYWQFKEIFYQLENPVIMFHHKFINSFTKEELEKITSLFDFSKAILNTSIFVSNEKNLKYNKLFLSHYFYGCYLCEYNIEISVDLDNSKYVLIENDTGKISKEKLFEIIKK